MTLSSSRDKEFGRCNTRSVQVTNNASERSTLALTSKKYRIAVAGPGFPRVCLFCWNFSPERKETSSLGEQTIQNLTFRKFCENPGKQGTPRGVVVSVKFGCFSPSRFSHYHCNAMRKAIKAHINLHTSQQNENTRGRGCQLPKGATFLQSFSAWKWKNFDWEGAAHPSFVSWSNELPTPRLGKKNPRNARN